MSATVLAYDMSWGIATSADACFRRMVRTNLLVALVLGISIPFLPLPEVVKPVVEEPPRLAQLIFEKETMVEPPPPKPAQMKPEPLPRRVESPRPVEKKPVVVKQPVPVKPRVTAREQAEKSGLVALRDSLSELRQNTVSSSFKKTRNLSQGAGAAENTGRAILTAGTARGSGGIQTADLSRTTDGVELSGRSTTQVHSPAGNAAGGAVTGKGKGKDGKSPGRSIEEIQMIFDRNKGSIYSVYNRALRRDPGLRGKIVLRLTIAPSGKVTRCELVSSELGDPVLGKKIASRVRLFNFGARDVSEITITYPIDFLPA